MTGNDGRQVSHSRRIPVVATATAALLLLASACGGSPAPGNGAGPGGSSGSASAVAYSACVRAHGVPNFPDPGPGGQVAKADPQQLGVSSSRLQAAQQACAQLIPAAAGSTAEQQQELRCATGDACPPDVVQRWMTGLTRLAHCLRTHGEPHWPDPVIASLAGHQPAPHFPYDQAGIDHHSPQVLAMVKACVQVTGFQGLPLP